MGAGVGTRAGFGAGVGWKQLEELYPQVVGQ